MSRTLFITDLDGTLLNNEAKITPVTAKIINGLIDEGMIFTYATARGLTTSSKVTKEINFKYPTVQHNGENIQNPQTGEYFDKCVFDKDKISETIIKAEKNNIFPVIYAFIGGKERVSWIQGKETDGIKYYLKGRKNDIRLRPIKDYGEFLTGDIYEMTFLSNSREELQEIINLLKLNSHFAYHIQEDTYKDTDGRSKFFLEIMRFDATKDFGTLKVKELVGADKVVCFGDNTNDIPMFNVSDEKYAVANAVDEVKNIATAIIGSNEDDGVAKWLEKYARNYF